MASDKEVKVKFTVETADTAKSLTDIKKAIKDLKAEALSAEFGSKKFQEAAGKAAELQDKLEDLGESMKSLKGSGVEKLNTSFGLLKDGISNMDFDKVKTAFKGVGSAMKAIPILAVVSAFQFLNEKFGIMDAILEPLIDLVYKFSDALGITNHQAQVAAEQATKSMEEMGKVATEAYSRQVNEAKAAGKSTVEIEKQKQKSIEATNAAIIKQLEATGELTDEQKKQLAEAKKNLLDAQSAYRVIEATDKKEKEDKAKKEKEERDRVYKENLEKWKAHQKELKDAENKRIEERNKKIAENLNLVAEAAKTEADIKEKYNVTTDEIDRRFAEISSKRNDLTNKEIYDRLIKQLDEEQKARDVAQKKKEDEEQKAKERQKKSIEDANKTLLDLEKLKNDSIISNKKSSGQDILNAQLANLDLQKQAELKSVGDNEEAKKNIEEKYRLLKEQAEEEASRKRRERDKAAFDSITNTATAGLNAFASLSDGIFAMRQSKMKKDSAEYIASQKKQFELSKKIQIASAVINGIQGVINALTAPSVVPEPFGSILKGVNAAIVAASTAGNIAKIKATTFEGGGGGGSTDSGSGGSSGGGGPTSAPSIQAAQLVTLGQPTLTRDIGQRDNKVVVTDKDIKSVGNKVNVIEDRSKIRLGE